MNINIGKPLHLHFNKVTDFIVKCHHDVHLLKSQISAGLSHSHGDIVLIDDAVFVFVNGYVAESWRSQTVLDVISNWLNTRVVKLDLL